MKVVHVFNIEEYQKALSPGQRGVYMQRGGGLGGAFGTIRRYSIPIIKEYVLPKLKSTAVNVAKEIFSGSNVKNAIKNNAVSLVKNVGSDMYSRLTQKGKGIESRPKVLKSQISPLSVLKVRSKITKPNKDSVLTKKSNKAKSVNKKTSPKNTKSKPKSKRDIFS